MSKHIVVVGTSFAGYTAALELRQRLAAEHRVTVIAPSPRFVFIPSLIWVPFGIRSEEDISFDVRPVYEKKGIEFLEARAEGFDLKEHRIRTNQGPIDYDYVVIATGPKVDFDMLPGLGPHKNSVSICTLEHATKTKQAWERFLANPGPAVVGATQQAACFGAAYEFILNMRYQLDRAKRLHQSHLTFLTAEPYLAHFGIGGFGAGQAMCEKLFDRYGIEWRTNAVVKEVTPGSVVLDDGHEIASEFTMLIPRFLGVDAVRNTPGLANEAGFIEADARYQHPDYPEVYAAGIAVHVPPPAETPVPCGVPKTGYPSEQMAKTAAHNIVVDVTGEGEKHELDFGDIKALCIMDTGNMGMMIIGDHMLPPREHEVIVPGPQAHWSKVVFEKHFMGSRRRGIV